MCPSTPSLEGKTRSRWRQISRLSQSRKARVMSRAADYCGELEMLIEWAMELIELHGRLRGLANPVGRERAEAYAWVKAADDLLAKGPEGEMSGPASD